MALSDGQHIVLIALAIISSLISITGSSLVFYVARRSLQKSPYHRLVAGMSIVDLIFSTFCILQLFLRPEYLHIPGAIGNFATCTFVGMFSLSGNLASAIYSVLISGNAYLLVCRQWNETAVANSWERKGHLLAAIIPLIIAIPAALTKTINPPQVAQLCLFYVYPQECFQNEDEIECSRGQYYRHFGYIFILTVILCTVISSALTINVYQSVKQTIRRSSQYDFEEHIVQATSANGDTNLDLGGGSNEQGLSTQQAPAASTSTSRRSQQQVEIIRSQTVSYLLAYINTIAWPIAVLISGHVLQDYDKAYGLRVLASFFYPLQGGLNMIVFFKPSVNTWKRSKPDLSIRQIMYAIVVDQKTRPPPSRSSTTSSR